MLRTTALTTLRPLRLALCAGAIACMLILGGSVHPRPALAADLDGDGIDDSVDNCPGVANTSQINTDNEIDNGPGIAPDDVTVPNGAADTMGDACDPGPDTDHDRLPNSADTEPLTATGICAGFAGANDLHDDPVGGDITNDDNGNGDPAPPLGNDAADDGPSWDTDNDAALDGAECLLGTNPRNGLSRPTIAQCGGSADGDGDGLTVAAEKCKWATSDGLTDTDGDGLADCIEANDTNGDGVANFPGDVINSAKAANNLIGKTMDFDLNGDGVVNFPGDTILSAKMVFHVGAICM